MLVKFELATGSKHSWPLKKSVLRDFAVFCICKKKLKAGSVRSYLAALSCLHRLRGWHDFEVKDTTINAILRGGTNLSLASGSFSSSPLEDPGAQAEEVRLVTTDNTGCLVL